MVYEMMFIARGSVAEWSKALVLGTSHFDGVGSNPTAAKKYVLFFPFFIFVIKRIYLTKTNDFM